MKHLLIFAFLFSSCTVDYVYTTNYSIQNKTNVEVLVTTFQGANKKDYLILGGLSVSISDKNSSPTPPFSMDDSIQVVFERKYKKTYKNCLGTLCEDRSLFSESNYVKGSSAQKETNLTYLFSEEDYLKSKK